MLLTIAILSATALVFSQELTKIIQKLIVIPGVTLFVPMILASCLVEMYEAQLYSYLSYLHDLLYHSQEIIAGFLPFQTGSLYLIRIVSLCVLACLPFGFFWFESRHRRSHTLPAIAYYMSAVLWSIMALVLVIQPI